MSAQKLVLGQMVAEWSFNMMNGNYMVFEWHTIEFTILFFSKGYLLFQH